MDKYLAHIDESGDEQTLLSHLQVTAEKAAAFFKGLPLEKWAGTCGMMHDLGKYSQGFQDRIRGNGEKLDHSSAGAQLAHKLFGDVGNLMGFAIAGHHSGLLDWDSNDACLRKRLDKNLDSPKYDYSAYSREIQFTEKLTPGDIASMLSDRDMVPFSLFMLTRMLFSAIVDADRLDTEEFMSPDKAEYRNKRTSINDMKSMMDNKIQKLLNSPKSDINDIRQDILKRCLDTAEQTPGVYSLTVPTGGGKTYSSLAFALRHAVKYGMERVIYVIPYTSIIEQNAQVFRDVFGDESVLEHHSNLDTEKIADDEDTMQLYQLAQENWDFPLIVTTSVQFFETLFTDHPGRARKMHNMAKSVIILDEAQMLPLDKYRPAVYALRELAANYGSTVLLCTATQPALSQGDFKGGFPEVTEIVENPTELADKLKRVDIEIIDGEQSTEMLVDRLKQHDRVLAIVNTRAEAAEIYDALAAHDENNAYHLSASMYPEHRSRIITQIKSKLKAGETCRVVSTQLIEAGVDIDFPVVYRTRAGIDNIAQAAGRCNREGKLRDENGQKIKGKVYVFKPERKAPSMFRQNISATGSVIHKHGDELLKPEAVKDYFTELLFTKGEDNLDPKNIVKKLSDAVLTLHYPFRTIGRDFRMIPDISKTVIVPDETLKNSIERDLKFRGDLTLETRRKAQRYSVSVYDKQYSQLLDYGFVREIKEGVGYLYEQKHVNKPSLYTEEKGLGFTDEFQIGPF